MVPDPIFFDDAGMVRAAIFVCVVAGLVWGVGVYRMGDKPLSGHLVEIYRSEIVQRKIEALEKGIDAKIADHVEKTKARRPAVTTKHERPAPAIEEPEQSKAETSKPEPKVVDARPPPQKPKTPKETITEQDREGLDHLLAEKLKR